MHSHSIDFFAYYSVKEQSDKTSTTQFVKYLVTIWFVSRTLLRVR